jgi:hypothetical protein
MYAMAVETDRFRLSTIFHSALTRKLSDDDSTVRQVLIPLPGYGHQTVHKREADKNSELPTEKS